MKTKEDFANKEYMNFIEKDKVEIPIDIEDIAFGKIDAHNKSINVHRLRVLGSSFAAAAIVVLAFLIIQPMSPTSELYSSNLTDTQKKEQFENALKIINESLSGQKPKPKTLYNDDNFEIILGK